MGTQASISDDRPDAEASEFIQKLQSGWRVPLTEYDDELRAFDALGSGLITPKFASSVFGCLWLRREDPIPLPVVRIILAYAIPRRLFISAYLGLRARRHENPKLCNYINVKQLFRDRREGVVRGVQEHNPSFTGIAPVALKCGEVFAGKNVQFHRGGLGVVTERFDSAKCNLRFCKESVVHYQQLSVLHSNTPEHTITLGRHVECISLHGYRNAQGFARRYLCFGDSSRGGDLVVWLPLHFDYPDGVSDATAVSDPDKLPQIFPALQVWNNGRSSLHSAIGEAKTPPRLRHGCADPFFISEEEWEATPLQVVLPAEAKP